MAGEHYQTFIKEAFLDPIRSVLIIDDDYPTYDDAFEEKGNDKEWRKHPTQTQRVIDNFRKGQLRILVDIDDGTGFGGGETAASRLHQSDLLILDYELDRTKSGDGTRAIEILRGLLVNNHFNLVVVYTKEELDTVFDTVRLGLIKPLSNLLSNNRTEEAKMLIEDCEDRCEGFSRRIDASIGAEQYLYSRFNSTYLRTMAEGQEPYGEFKERCDAAGWDSEQRRLVFLHLLERVEQGSQPAMNPNQSSDDALQCSTGSTKWIKSDSAFVAFSRKTHDNDLLNVLHMALGDWQPEPSRLFLAKLRAAMDEYGITAQDQALTHRHALAHWYHRLLRSDDRERSWHVTQSISRHADRLMDEILPHVETFAERLIEAESSAGGDAKEICLHRFDVDLNETKDIERAILEHNAFMCSKEPAGWHLTIGHIFIMREEYWICLSPACDMEPSQLHGWRQRAFGEYLPFIAVKLHQINHNRLPEDKDIQSNRYIFLRLEGKVRILCFNSPSAPSGFPHWYTVFADERGKLSDGTLEFSVLRVETEQGETELVVKRHEARVVGQLRYEYALNLIGRLGNAVTRIGLDFSDRRTM